MASKAATLHIDGKEYVVLPKAEYLRLTHAENGLVDAKEFLRTSIGADLRKAREHAGLSQTALAKKLGVTQPMVSATEAGRTHVSEKYIRRVLKACKLPTDWAPPEDSGDEKTKTVQWSDLDRAAARRALRARGEKGQH